MLPRIFSSNLPCAEVVSIAGFVQHSKPCTAIRDCREGVEQVSPGKVSIAAGTASSLPLLIRHQIGLWARMFDVFHWRTRMARKMAYAKRAEECSWAG